MTNTIDEFDLLTEPWIPVRPASGDSEPAELSLLEVLRRAGEIAGITDASPLATCAIQRFLFAVHRWYLPPADLDEWEEQWQDPDLGTRLATVIGQRCAGKLRLFSKERPFYQSGDIPLAGKPSEPLKSVGYLAPEASTGTNIAHFSHDGEAAHRYCPACCSKGLLVQAAFATAGGAGIKPGINGVPPLYLIPQGSTLRQTLVLNSLVTEHLPELAGSRDPGPLWEQADPSVARSLEKSTTGFAESLTWPPRRVRLFPGEGGDCSRCGRPSAVLVRRMVYAQGWSRAKAVPLWQDAWAAYRQNGTKPGAAERIPVRPQESRDAWRDFPALFLNDAADTIRPAVLDQISSLFQDGTLPPDTAVVHEVFGLRTDMKAKIFEWRRDSFRFPPALLEDRHAQQEVRRALTDARDGGESALRAGLRRLLQDNGDFNYQNPLASVALRQYWQTLEGEFRGALLQPALTGGAEQQSVWRRSWWDTVERTARGAMDLATRSMESYGDAWKREVEAGELFGRTLGSYRKKAGLSPAKGGTD